MVITTSGVKVGAIEHQPFTTDVSYVVESGHEMAKTARDSYLRRTYGITEAEYEAILKEQNGACWICGKAPKNRRLHVDHLHLKRDKKQPGHLKRPNVRGLLCWSCNGAIAKFKDDPVRLKKAAQYCETWPAQRVLKKETECDE